MSTIDINETYLDFLKWSLRQSLQGESTDFVTDLSEADYTVSAFAIDWHHLLTFAKRQALVGVYWEGIERLSNMSVNKPTDSDVMEWMGAVRLLRKRSAVATEKTAWVADNFNKEGFRACILKGQGAALLYPKHDMRTSGDIDIWVKPVHPDETTGHELSDKELLARQKHDVDKVITYCRNIYPKARAVYHHIEFRNAGPVPVEVHYRPSWFNSPINNRRLQIWFEANADRQFVHMTQAGFSTPTDDFNVVYMLCHILGHVLQEGVGLRHIVDYYYLLCHYQPTGQETALLRRLGLGPIASAVMWVLSKKLGLPAQHLIYQPDTAHGKMLLYEMLSGGNFGKFDKRPLSGAYNSHLLHNLQRLARDARLCTYFTSEACWEPWFRVYNFIWRLRHN